MTSFRAPETGARLKAARQAKFATAAEFARSVAEKAVTIRALESGQNALSVAKATKFASHLGCSAEWLLWGRNEEHEPAQESVIVSMLKAASRKTVPFVTLPNTDLHIRAKAIELAIQCIPGGSSDNIVGYAEVFHKFLMQGADQ